MKNKVGFVILILAFSFLLSSLITFFFVDKKIEALQENVPVSSGQSTSAQGTVGIEILEAGQAESAPGIASTAG